MTRLPAFLAYGFAAIVFFCHGTAISAGWLDLRGANAAGDVLVVSPACESRDQTRDAKGNACDYSVEANRESYHVVQLTKGQDNNQTNVTYGEQRCTFHHDSAGRETEFSCAQNGKSALSGVTYQIVPNPDPEDCAYYAKFHCIANCAHPSVPAVLIQSRLPECMPEPSAADPIKALQGVQSMPPQQSASERFMGLITFACGLTVAVLLPLSLPLGIAHWAITRQDIRQRMWRIYLSALWASELLLLTILIGTNGPRAGFDVFLLWQLWGPMLLSGYRGSF